jgi:ribulose-5-phosphate 4-epimerase/fuculose-1-phosphate aldolase
MHTHTTAGSAVSCLRDGLSMSNFYAFQLHGRVAYHDFEGITLYADEGPRLLKSIGAKPAVILRNHGLLSWGRTLAQAFNTLYLLERACQLQVAALAMGPVIVPDESIQAKCARDSLQLDPNYGGGQDVVDALTRLVDRVDPTYRL